MPGLSGVTVVACCYGCGGGFVLSPLDDAGLDLVVDGGGDCLGGRADAGLLAPRWRPGITAS